MRLPLRLVGLLFGTGLWLVSCRHLPPPTPTPAVSANTGTLKIMVQTDGFYRLTPAELAPFANPATIDWSTATLTTGGEAVPFLVADNALIFYGLATDNRYTKFRPYLLTLAGADGGPVIPVADLANAGSATPLTHLARTHHLENNTLYRSSAFTPAHPQEPWFWQTIQVEQAVTLPFALPAIGDGGGSLRLHLYGTTTDRGVKNDHDLDVRVNDQPVGQVQWDGETYVTVDLEMPAGTLHPGENTLTLDNSAPGAAFLDISLLDWVEITYSAPPIAVDDWYDGLTEAAGTLDLTGFSAPPLLFDITDPRRPRQLRGETQPDGRVSLAVPAGLRLAAVGPGAFRRPTAIAPLRETAWRAPDNQADLIIISPDALLPALAPLAAARQKQGLRVAQVPLAEIYDQFGAGLESPESIRTFLRFAMQTWQPPQPRYLLLVGEATYDYRDYLGLHPVNLVPPLLIAAQFSGETISDARLADVDDDGRPNLAVGRWPVADAGTAGNLVQRTLAYEQGQPAPYAIFTADGTSREFARFSDALVNQSGLNAAAARLYGANADQVTQAWNEGAWLVTYTGHGSTDMWGKDDVFSADAVANLEENNAPPIVLQFTCLTGFFAHPDVDAISETLLRHPGGPVLLIAATSLTLSTSQEPFATGLVSAIHDPHVQRIGDALRQAKANLNVEFDSLREISDTFGLLGDPSALIRRP